VRNALMRPERPAVLAQARCPQYKSAQKELFVDQASTALRKVNSALLLFALTLPASIDAVRAGAFAPQLCFKPVG